jgi:hypothetical protein
MLQTMFFFSTYFVQCFYIYIYIVLLILYNREDKSPVFSYVMENELENNLLMFYFSQVY